MFQSQGWDFCGIKNPVILWFIGIKNRGFIPHKSRNPEIFIPQKSRKIPFNFRPFPEKFLSFLCLFNLHNFLYNHPIPFPIFTKKIDVARPLLHEGRKARVNKIYLSPALYDTPTRPHNLEISFTFLQAFNSLFLAKKETAKNAEFTRATRNFRIISTNTVSVWATLFIFLPGPSQKPHFQH